MTHEELDALPETGGFGYREEIRDGIKTRIPVMNPAFALWQKPDEPVSVLDSEGRRWMIGWANGIKYKRRMRDL